MSLILCQRVIIPSAVAERSQIVSLWASEAKGGGTNSIEKTSVASGAINCLAASAEGASMRFDRRRLVSFDR